MATRVAFRVRQTRTTSQPQQASREEREMIAIVRRALKRRDPHPDWLAEILRLEAEGLDLDDRVANIFNAFTEAVESGKAGVKRPAVELGTDYGISKHYNLFPGCAPKGWELHGKPFLATTPDQIDNAERFLLAGDGKSRKPAVLRRRRKVKAWAARLRRDLVQQQKRYHAALAAFQGYGALEKKMNAMFDRRWKLIDKCAFTPARTVAGCQAQARLVVYLIEAGGGSNWTRREDLRAAENITASLSRIAKGGQ